MTALAEQLGYGPDARLLIVNADELGFCHATNVGVYEALRSGGASSASLMVPCPWAREAAARYRGEDVGVHLTLNAEQELYRFGPITHAPSLLGGDGGFPATVEDVWDHADLDETRRECRAQIERAILWGFDVSHLDTHLTTLQLRPEFFDVYLDLALEFQLPLRMVDDHLQGLLGFPAVELARSAGAIFSDHLVSLPGGATAAMLQAVLERLEPGVTELHLRPAVDSDELRALAPDWAERVGDHRLLCGHPNPRVMAAAAGIEVIGFRPLRALARNGSGRPVP
jgi:predicted glycoside hydrolase/deacetylase ChbG (UPF0249 family)